MENFFINIGPGRCGTSWLYSAFSEHPEISMAKIKETEFFNYEYVRGVEWYKSLFKKNGVAFGEISNNYFLNKNAIERIHNFNSETKIIINLREPHTLLNSILGFAKRRGLEFKNFKLSNIPYLKIMGKEDDSRNFISVLDAINHIEIINFCEQLFGEENVYIFIFERINYEPELLLEEIYRFIGVNENFKSSITHSRINQAIIPRVKIFGTLSYKFAAFLRFFHLYRLLDFLKKSNIIKKIFFKRLDLKNTDLLAETDYNYIQKDEILSIKKEFIIKFPELKRFWGA